MLLAAVRELIGSQVSSEKLSKQEFDAYRKRVVHTLSHEFRTPLSAINVGIELLMEHRESLDSDRATNVLEAVRRGGQRLERLVRELMGEVIGAAERLGYPMAAGLIEDQLAATRTMAAYRPSSMIHYVEGREVEVESIWGDVALPDARLHPRLRKTVAMMIERLEAPVSCVPRKLVVGAHRLWNNARVKPESLVEPMIAHQAKMLTGALSLVVAHDTMEIDLTGRYQTEDSGPLRSAHAPAMARMAGKLR
jgi:hypothetical protein